MILRGIVNVLKAIVTGIAKVVAWLLLALGLWLPAIYSVVFFVVCAITETSFSDIRGLFFLGLGLATVLSVWYTLSTNRSKKKKSEKTAQGPTYMSKLKVKEDKVQYKRGEPVSQAAPIEEREEVSPAKDRNREEGEFLPYRRKDYSDYDTPQPGYERQDHSDYREGRHQGRPAAQDSRDMRGGGDSYYRPKQDDERYGYGQREQDSHYGYQDDRSRDRSRQQPAQQYYERPDRDMRSEDGYGGQQRYGSPPREDRAYDGYGGGQDGFYPYKPREEKRGLSDPPKEKFSSYHADERDDQDSGLYQGGPRGRGVDTLFNRDASDRYGFSAYNSSGTKQDYYSQAGWNSPRSDLDNGREMPKIFATRNDKDVLIYEYGDRLEYYRRTLAGLRLESVKYKDDNYA